MINDNGKMFSKDQAIKYAKKHKLPFCTIEDLVEYQNKTFPNIEKIVKAKLTTEYGLFDITIYKELFKEKEHVFLSMGDYTNGVLRIHSECFTGDVLFSKIRLTFTSSRPLSYQSAILISLHNRLY